MIRASKLFLLCLVGILPSLVAIHLYRELSSVRKGIAKESSPSAKAEVWTCPMHLQYTSDKPGPCPICGMDLVPQRSLRKDHPVAEFRFGPTVDDRSTDRECKTCRVWSRDSHDRQDCIR